MSKQEELYYIWNGDYAYNGFVWWAENKNGYTAYLENAGKYTREEAYSITKNRESDLAILVSVIEESKGNFTITDAQYIDKNQFLNFEKLKSQPAPGRFVPESEIKKLREAYDKGSEDYSFLVDGVIYFLKAIEKGGSDNA